LISPFIIKCINKTHPWLPLFILACLSFIARAITLFVLFPNTLTDQNAIYKFDPIPLYAEGKTENDFPPEFEQNAFWGYLYN